MKTRRPAPRLDPGSASELKAKLVDPGQDLGPIDAAAGDRVDHCLLHECQAHPDFEYAIMSGVLTGSAGPVPAGEGWHRNVHRGRAGAGLDRYRLIDPGRYDETYWMRRRPTEPDLVRFVYDDRPPIDRAEIARLIARTRSGDAWRGFTDAAGVLRLRSDAMDMANHLEAALALIEELRWWRDNAIDSAYERNSHDE